MYGKCHKVQEKHFKKTFVSSPSPWGSARTPIKSKGPPLTKEKIENHQIVLFDGSNEASCLDALIATQKKPELISTDCF